MSEVRQVWVFPKIAGGFRVVAGVLPQEKFAFFLSSSKLRNDASST